ncbi:MAG: endonuclease/exonuclease/phosphatase family protein [Bacteroidetes bacterium]|nr:endonuclease/exonuclease/phosphatase family protein [Bacteroidota bacterium]
MKKIIFLFIFSIISCTLISQTTIKVASFNIQNFGKSKLSQKEIVDTLATIVRMFDVIAIQEISDVSNQTPKLFLDIINKANKFHYKFICSQRTGNQLDDKSSQEQYVFYFNSDKLTLIDSALYDDSKNDFFQREPFLASFKTKNGSFSFIICTIHTNPTQAVKEIASLIEVAKWIPNKFKKTKNLIFCGDFNASCNYAKPAQLSNLSIHNPPYHWIIPDTTKTNLSVNENCAYDRFVVTDSLLNKVKHWSVLHYFKSKKVSDHWPVYIELTY